MEQIREIDVAKAVTIFTDYFKKQDECAKNGHPNAYVESTTVYGFHSKTHMVCPDCGACYSRPATPAELASLDFCFDI